MKNTAKFVFYKDCIINDFVNTIYFDNDNVRDNFFDTNFETLNSVDNNYNYVRSNSTISTAHDYYNIMNCKYGYLIESNKPNFRQYFRIVSVDYVNLGTSLITFAFDILMTYNSGNALLNNISLADIERRHLPKVKENHFLQSVMNSGDIIPKDTVWNIKTDTEIFDDYVILITTSVDMEKNWGNMEKPKMPVSSGGTYDGSTSPQNLYQTSEENFYRLMEFLKDYPYIAQNITSAIKVPSRMFDTSDLVPVNTNDGSKVMLNKFKNGAKSKNFHLDLQYSRNDLLEIFGIDKDDSYMLRSPYFYLEMTNWQGGKMPIYFEKLDWTLDGDDKKFLYFNCQLVLGYDNKLVIYPINYMSNGDNTTDESGVGRGSYLDVSIVFENFDSVSMLIDNYKLDRAKSAYTTELENSRQLSSRIRNITQGTSENNSISDRLNDAYSIVQNYGSSNPLKVASNVLNGFVDEHNYYQNQEARYSDSKIQQPTVTTQTNSNSFQIKNNIFGLTIKFKSINKTDYQSVKRYYKTFGCAYPYNDKIQKPINYTIMDYVKATPLQFSDDRISSEMQEIVSLILQNGVKFWHENGKGKNVFKQNLLDNVERL